MRNRILRRRRTYVSLLGAVLWTALTYGAGSPPLNALQDIAKQSAESLPVANASLAIGQGFRPDLPIQKYTAQLDALAGELKPRLDAAPTLESKLRVMAELIYQKWEFGAQKVLPPTVFTGLDDVLDKKHWNCFGMTLLYLGLGERVGLPLHMVAGRGHAFVCYAGSPPLYIETTQGGRVYGSKDYLKSYLPFPCLSTDEYTVLDKRQALAVIAVQTALALQNQKQWSAARAYYEGALRFDPKQAEAQTGIGFALLGEGKGDDAAVAFRKATEMNPTFREAFGGLGECLHAKGDTEGALQAYQKVIALCPDEPKAQFNFGQLLYEKNDLDGAIAAYRKYTVLAPNDADGYARLAFPLEDKGDLDGAAAAYKKALNINPRFTDAHINLGHLLEKRNDVKAAEASFRSAVSLQPQNPLALSGLGRALTAQKRIDEALKCLQKASELDPGNAGIWIDYGNATRAAGDGTKAIGMYKRAIERDPTDPEAYLALAETQREIGAVNDAKASATKARALGATLPPSLAALLQAAPPAK
jgi:tetratricopeptide (TPR) repeat protein